MAFVDFKNRNVLRKAWAKEKKEFESATSKPVVYKSGFTVKGKAYNYLNTKSSNFAENCLKPLVTSIFDDLEKIYPSAGEIFLNYVMSTISSIETPEQLKEIEDYCDEVIHELKKKSRNIHKNDFFNFLDSEISSKHHDFINDLVENITIDTKIYLEESLVQQTIIKKMNSFTFELDFDCDFLLKKENWEARDYNFVIIDGFIDSVGEIYHLLTQASENMEPYVIFCKGMKPDVKNVIMQNLMRGTINVFPVSLEINEMNLNIMADLAMCHKSDVVSSLQGETISIATRRKLSRGKKIKIGHGYINLDPVASDKTVRAHRKYLNNRKLEAKLDANSSLIDRRLKMLNNDKLILKLSKKHRQDIDFLNDFKKITYFLKSGSTGIVNVEDMPDFNKFCKLLPTAAGIKIMISAKSFCKTVYNTHGAVIIN